MNAKNNKRHQETAESINKAFVSLLQDKELREITVTDICELADIPLVKQQRRPHS